jgi:hypothetical protein
MHSRDSQAVAVANPRRQGDLGEGIVEASLQLGADLVVMGTREFAEWLPLQLIDAVGVPVLLVPDTRESTPSATCAGVLRYSDASESLWRPLCDV